MASTFSRAECLSELQKAWKKWKPFHILHSVIIINPVHRKTKKNRESERKTNFALISNMFVRFRIERS